MLAYSSHRTPCTQSADDRARISHPPHSLHRERHDRARRFHPHRTPCIESADDRARIFLYPPHSLHLERRRPCSQIDPPPHSLQSERSRPCSQINDPPHSLHRVRRRPCGQAPAHLAVRAVLHPVLARPVVPREHLFRFVPFLVDSSLRFSSASAPSISGTGILTRGRHTVVIPPSRPVKCERTNFSNEPTGLRFPRKDRDIIDHSRSASRCVASRWRHRPRWYRTSRAGSAF